MRSLRGDRRQWESYREREREWESERGENRHRHEVSFRLVRCSIFEEKNCQIAKLLLLGIRTKRLNYQDRSLIRLPRRRRRRRRRRRCRVSPWDNNSNNPFEILIGNLVDVVQNLFVKQTTAAVAAAAACYKYTFGWEALMKSRVLGSTAAPGHHHHHYCLFRCLWWWSGASTFDPMSVGPSTIKPGML